MEQALRDGWSEDEAVERIDLSGWNLSILPSLHGGKFIWATARNNVRWAYRMSKGQRGSCLSGTEVSQNGQDYHL